MYRKNIQNCLRARHKNIHRKGTGELHSFLNSAPDTGEWSPARYGRFTPQGKTPRTHLIRDWVNPRAGLGDLEKRKASEPCWKLNSDRPASRLFTIQTTPCRIGFYVTKIEAQIKRKLVYFEPLTAETRLRYQASPCGSCDGQSDIEMCPCQLMSLCLVSIIPSMPLLPMPHYLTN